MKNELKIGFWSLQRWGANENHLETCWKCGEYNFSEAHAKGRAYAAKELHKIIREEKIDVMILGEVFEINNIQNHLLKDTYYASFDVNANEKNNRSTQLEHTFAFTPSTPFYWNYVERKLANDRKIPKITFTQNVQYRVRQEALSKNSQKQLKIVEGYLRIVSKSINIYPIHNKNNDSRMNLENVISDVDKDIGENDQGIHIIVGDTNVKRKIQDDIVTTDNKWYDAMLDDDGDVTMDGCDDKKIDRAMYRVPDEHYYALADIQYPKRQQKKIDDSIELNVKYVDKRTSNGQPISNHPFCVYTLKINYPI